jgi:hypothetical protein
MKRTQFPLVFRGICSIVSSVVSVLLSMVSVLVVCL